MITTSHRNQPDADTQQQKLILKPHQLCYMFILCNRVFTLIIDTCVHVLCSQSHRHVCAVAGWGCHVARALG